MSKEKIMLHDIDVILMHDFPSCRSKCPYQNKCGNHMSADEEREEHGYTPDLRQVVLDSWRCNKNPKNKRLGAILTNGRTVTEELDCGFEKNIMNALFDNFGFTDFSIDYGEDEDEDEDEGEGTGGLGYTPFFSGPWN